MHDYGYWTLKIELCTCSQTGHISRILSKIIFVFSFPQGPRSVSVWSIKRIIKKKIIEKTIYIYIQLAVLWFPPCQFLIKINLKQLDSRPKIKGGKVENSHSHVQCDFRLLGLLLSTGGSVWKSYVYVSPFRIQCKRKQIQIYRKDIDFLFWWIYD